MAYSININSSSLSTYRTLSTEKRVIQSKDIQILMLFLETPPISEGWSECTMKYSQHYVWSEEKRCSCVIPQMERLMKAGEPWRKRGFVEKQVVCVRARTCRDIPINAKGMKTTSRLCAKAGCHLHFIWPSLPSECIDVNSCLHVAYKQTEQEAQGELGCAARKWKGPDSNLRLSGVKVSPLPKTLSRSTVTRWWRFKPLYRYFSYARVLES